MDDSMLMHVLDGLQDLLTVALHLQLGQLLTALDLLVQSRVGAYLHDDVDIFLILEEVFELHDVWVMHRPVDADLALQLLLGS